MAFRDHLARPIICVSASVLLVGHGFAADTHTINASDNPLAWTYNGQSSGQDKQVVVDDLKIGDVVEIVVPKPGNHGFITTIRNPDSPADLSQSNAAPELVLACGEQEPKPTAVLKETECGGASQFGSAFAGTMKLEVLASFSGPVEFWCTEHFDLMPGVLKLKQ